MLIAVVEQHVDRMEINPGTQMDVATTPALRSIITARTAISRQKTAQLELEKSLNNTKMLGRRALQKAGLQHFDIKVQKLNSQLHDQSHVMETMQRQINASTTAFYGSVVLDVARARPSSANSEAEAKSKQKEDDLAAYPGEDITHLYARSHLQLQKAWHDLVSFRDTYDSMLENKVNQRRLEKGFMNSELRKNIERDCTAVWVKKWLDHLAIYRRTEAAFIKRRDMMTRLGLIHTLPKSEQHREHPDDKKWTLPVIHTEREGRDLPVCTGEDPEDGAVESLAPSEGERIDRRMINQRSAIEVWVANIERSESLSERVIFAQQPMEERNDLDVMPCDCLSEAESIPQRRKKITGYQQSYV